MISVHRLHLTDITPAPDLAWTRATYPVFSHLILHPTGPILIDTGVGIGHPRIDEWYSPVHHDLDEALNRHGVGVDDIGIVITSHLHFDHCGHNERFPHATVLVQRTEAEAAMAPNYTVPDWAFPPDVELSLIEGDHDVVPGVRIIATPGHSPGHQSVLIEDHEERRTVVCCQASWNQQSFAERTMGDDGWDLDTGTASVQKLHSSDPHRALFSHDPGVWQRPL